MKRIPPKLKKLIESYPNALATVGANLEPNVIAVAFVKVVSGTELLISDNFMKQTLKNLSCSKKVGIAVWDKKWKGCKIAGTARYYDSGKWAKFVREMPENKGLPAKGAVLVKVRSISMLG